MANPRPSGFSWLAILPVFFGWLVYGQVIGFGLVEYDDPAFLSGNARVNAGLTASGLRWAWTLEGGDGLRAGVENLWHPLAWMSHMADHSLWGTDYGGHHTTSLVLFLATAVLVHQLAFHLTRSAFFALVASLFFTLHPLQAESVAWLSDRKGVLGNFFLFASLLVYSRNDGGLRTKVHVFSITLGIAAMLSKPSAVVLPALLVVVDLWKENESFPGRLWWWRSISGKWPWILPAIATAVIAVVLQTGGSHGSGPVPAMERMAMLPLNFFHALVRMVVPTRLAMHYPAPEAEAWEQFGLWMILLGVPCLLFVARSRLLFGAWCWMLACWLPVSGLVYVGTSFSTDRYAALMWSGPCLALALGMSRARVCWSRPAVVFGLMVLSPVLVPLAVLSHRQTATWASTRSLYEHALAAQPGDPIIANNHAGMLLAEGETAEAEVALRDAINRFPGFARLQFNHGLALARLGREGEAVAAYREALAIDPFFSDAWLNLGLLLDHAVHTRASAPEIVECFEKAIAHAAPGDIRPRLALAHHHVKRGQRDLALGILDALPDPPSADPASARHADDLRARALRIDP